MTPVSVLDDTAVVVRHYSEVQSELPAAGSFGLQVGSPRLHEVPVGVEPFRESGAFVWSDVSVLQPVKRGQDLEHLFKTKSERLHPFDELEPVCEGDGEESSPSYGSVLGDDQATISVRLKCQAVLAAGRAVTRVSLGDDPVVTLAPRRLERIVENLVRNAQTHGNGVTDVRVESNGDVVRLIVEDHGPGVPDEARERIFDRFAKGSTSARSSGVGLGLSLVSEHVRMNGGRVWVEDGPQGGARFIVELPASSGDS